jgi:ATP-binding cassette subfamily F protein 3
VLSARDLTLRRGPEPLFEQVNFTVFRGNKVGITGANGSGKSSLFAAIRGELHPDRGDIEAPTGLKIGYVEQEIESSPRAAIEFVLDGDLELRKVLAAIADAESRDAAMELAEAHAAYQSIDGYAREPGSGDRARARFQDGDHRRKVANSPAAGACVWEWRAHCVRGPICCRSMNRPITRSGRHRLARGLLGVFSGTC